MKLDKQREELYYFEGSRVVFTPQYHIERGYCCGSGCRHCPYDPQHQKDTKNISEEFKYLKNGNS